MDWFNYAIVGSGPAGIAAARRLEGQGACLIDAGNCSERLFPYSTLDSGLAAGDVEALLGDRWEMLANLVEPGSTHPKLRARDLRYIVQGERFTVHGRDDKILMHGSGSYAAGGLSNAWGAQLFRYTDTDLVEAGDWPLAAASLEPYYQDLEEHIGIAGEADEMYEFLGTSSHLLPPTPLVPAAQSLLASYYSHKDKVQRRGFRLGRARLALLTRPHRGYAEYRFGQTEFFSSDQPGMYTARRTLDELRSRESIAYLGGHKLLSFTESTDYVEIELADLHGNSTRKLRVRHLLLGCGTVHTARLVLLSRRAFGRAVPFLDQPPTLLPIFLPTGIGSELPTRSCPIQLTATLSDADGRAGMISFYYPGALLRADLLPDVPLPMNAALRVLRQMIGAMLVLQIWDASRPVPGNRLMLDPAGEIRIEYPERSIYRGLTPLLKAMRTLGAFAFSGLASLGLPGWGFHYAGCLPMRRHPGPYETHVDGRLWDSKRIRVIDGSVFPSLPAKNHSLTLMANAARIADETLRCGY